MPAILPVVLVAFAAATLMTGQEGSTSSIQPDAPKTSQDLRTKPDAGAFHAPSPEKVADGFRFTEGPVWHPEGYLVFSDIPADTVYRWSPGGEASVVRHPAGHPNGNAIDAENRLVTAEHDGRITRTDGEGKTIVLVDAYEGKALHSPNDLVIAADGTIYFTDPTFGLRGREAQMDHRGVYRLTTDGALQLLSDDFELPNGVALSADEKTLYMSDSRTNTIHTFDLTQDEPEARLLAELKDEGVRGIADGLKVDSNGTVYATGPGGVWVLDAEGAVLGRIPLPGASNLCFGGEDGSDLYVTARDAVYRLSGVLPIEEPPETGRSRQ